MSEQLLDEAQRFLEWVKGTTTELDSSDGSVFFIQAVLESVAKTPEDAPIRTVQSLAYAIYLADLLADRCRGVQLVVERNASHLRDVLAVRDGGPELSTLSWIESCLDDPRSGDIVFRYAGALRDFGAFDRAKAIFTRLSEEAAAMPTLR
ncbi:hypothetical protein V7968_32070 [Nocardia vulneris]|uniref:hypothetical protein n=1 Tax=Nocardia TaxID=1817 RepID=UPI00080F5737|nr:hypothetical protein [Nocardia brasiliensis]OCF85539.1 hypothetical protein AW168_35350 [Nocardia brasiliensis]